jgi:hypothetical protein
LRDRDKVVSGNAVDRTPMLSFKRYIALLGSGTVTMRFVLVLLVVVVCQSCSTRSIDCAIETPHSECAPDTEGHRAALEEMRATQMTGSIDDARCRSYGWKPGSPEYTQCRAELDNERMPPSH